MTRAIAIVVVMWSSAAFAQPASAQAEVLFRQGRDLMAAGKVAEACSAFDESQRLEPEITTLLNVAACREKLGQLATAWGLFLDAARVRVLRIARMQGRFAFDQQHQAFVVGDGVVRYTFRHDMHVAFVQHHVAGIHH